MPTPEPWLWLTALWLSREIIGHIIRWIAVRSGRIGCIPDKCGFYHQVVIEGGERIVAKFDPDHYHEDERFIPFHISAELFNDTDTPLVLQNFSLSFWNPNEPVIKHTNPDVSSKKRVVTSIRIDAHDTEAIAIDLQIERHDLQDFYAETLPVLTTEDVIGRTHTFRLSHRSFYGDESVVWPSKLRKWPKHPDGYPIYNKLALNPTYTAWKVFLIDIGIRERKRNSRLDARSTNAASSEGDDA